jgi:hypothetical protein
MFDDRLQATLTLAIGSSTLTIPAGAVERIEIDARTWGFSAIVSFWVSSEAGADDALFAPFTSTDIAQATLAIANGRLVLEGETPTVATFLGHVTERSFEETTGKDIAGQPVIERLYTVRFTDAAQAFWKAHRPISLVANKSLSEVIDANLAQGMIMEYSMPRLQQAQEMVCVGLGGGRRASFYDFVVWVVDDLCGVLELDAATGTYRIARDKAAGEAATDLDAESVLTLRVLPPALHRHTITVLNPFTEATAAKTDVANSLAATGVRADVIEHTPVASRVEQRAKVEGDRLRQRDHHVEVVFSQLPPAFPVPGVKHKVGEGFSKKLYSSGKTYRSIAFTFRAGTPEGEQDAAKMEEDSAIFTCEVRAEFERDTDPVPNLPPFEPCNYPVLAEGKVLSASGAETDRTWNSMTGEDDSVVRYRIHIPLWNQNIVAPFVPFGESGHFFFPAYKNQRVLVAFELHAAKIVSFLDWAGKLATSTQGNQLVMGKRDASSTVMKHVYTDDSPVLTLVRTQAGDKQTMELSEGRFFLEVKEEETQAAAEETYDLTPQADVAKEQAASQANAGIGEVTGNYESSMGEASGALTSAKEETSAAVTGATTELSGKVAEVETSLSDMAAGLDASGDAVSAAVAQAKSELSAALEEP